MSDLATGAAETAVNDFLAQFPDIERNAIAVRMDRAFLLYANGNVHQHPGLAAIFEVGCSNPASVQPGVQTSYTVDLSHSNPRGWRCECPDHLYRGVTCKHQLAAWLFSAYGPTGRDLELEAWLDRMAAEAEATPDGPWLEMWERSIA
jgi:hypothetical protein